MILFTFLCVHLSSQETANPFEIQSRLDSIYESENTAQDSPDQVIDPDNVVQSINEVVDPDTESAITPPVAERKAQEKDSSAIMTDSDINPFDVSHVPIRKSKLKKEADAFATKDIDTIDDQSNSFLFILILISCFLIAIVINTQRGAILKIVKGITNENVLKLNHREEKKGINGHYFLLYITYMINAAIFAYLIIYNARDMGGWQIFKWCIIGVAAVYILKHAFLYILGQTFPISKEAGLYSFTIQSFNLFLGLILIPFNLIIGFGPVTLVTPMIYLAALVIGILILIRSFRGLLIASRWISTNFFHFFLYLCAFEILPILLFIKVIGKF